MVSDELICAAREGDVVAQKAVLSWLYDKLKLAPAYIPVPDIDRDDVHHDALQAILQKMIKKEGPQNAEAFESWAKGFPRLQVKKYWAERRARYENERDYACEEDERPKTTWFSQLRREQRRQLLPAFLELLSQKYRSPIEHRLTGGTDRSYARLRDLPMGTVRWLRMVGRERLRKMYAIYQTRREHASSTPS